jgi:phosphotriesterase-related protein
MRTSRAFAYGLGMINSVRGPLDPGALGVTLMHEHVLVDFAGATVVHRSRYDHDEAFVLVLPYLQRLAKHGCRTLVECTPAYLGRDVELLARLSDASGLNILTNTGYYAAVQDRYLPPQAFGETSSGIARRWIDEWRRGIGSTAIKPAFMKISVDAGPLSTVDARIVDAAILTHRETGLAIHSHTPDAVAGLAQIDRIEREGVPLHAFVWVHAQSVKDPGVLVAAAARGVWIELDGVAPDSLARHVDLVVELKSHGHLGRLLISHDAGWYRVGEQGGAPGKFRGYELVLTDFVPALLARGLREGDIDQLLRANPARALTGTP